MYIYMYIYIFVCVCVCVCVFVCVCVCVKSYQEMIASLIHQSYSQDQETFLASSVHKQTRNYDTEY